MRPARAITVCVRGRPPRTAKHNAERISWLAAVTAEIVAKLDWLPVDAVLFPAGYFWLDEPLVTSPIAEQAGVIQRSQIASACRHAAQQLDLWSPGALLVIGLDTDSGGQAPARRSGGGRVGH